MEIKDTTEKKRLQEYIATIQNIAENTSALGSEQESFLESVRGLKQSLESGVYRVAVVGEFSTGKSTFINALMGEKILYASNKEATGAVTAIRRGDKAYVNIYTKDNSMIEKFSLDNEEGKKKLNEYLDINSGKNAGYVEINYPITEIDENIYFVDTPGIEKMSPQQMELTRDALKNANAIIFLIKKEGFTEPALKIITGKHEVIDEKNINDLKRAVSMQQLRIKQLVRKENHLKEQREKTERAINTIEKGEIAFKKKNSDRYLARKKDDVVSCCTDLRRELLDQAITESEHYFNEYKKNIENNAKDAVEKAVKEYIARLKSDNENILQENPEIIQNKDYIKKITEIKEEIKL